MARKKRIVLDIGKEVDRWQLTYIVYHTSHLREYGDAGKATAMFNNRTKNTLAQMKSAEQEAQINVLLAAARQKGKSAQETLKVIRGLKDGDLLYSTLDKIADALNEGIEKTGGDVTAQNYQKYLNSVADFSEGLKDKQKIEDFFNTFMNAMNLAIGAKGVNAEGLEDILQDALGPYYKELGGRGKLRWTPDNKIKAIHRDDADLASLIVQELAQAIEKNGITSNTFAQTVSRIFYDYFGDAITKRIIAEGYKCVDDIVSEELLKKNYGRARFTSNASAADSGSNMGYHMAETMKNGRSGTRHSVVSVFNQRAFELVVTENGQSYNIGIGVNTASADTSQPSAETGDITFIAHANLGSMFQDKSQEKYLAYNTLMHRNSGEGFDEAYRSLQGTIAASFFQEWIGGTGNMISGRSGYVDKAQFLLINGRVYSFPHIVRNICEKVTSNGEIPGLEMPGLPVNKWRGKSSSIPQAKTRSTLINRVLNTLVIGMNLNSNALAEYAY